MKVAFFDTHPFEKDAFLKANANKNHEFLFLEPRLIETTAILAKDYPCICAFANDQLSEETLTQLKAGGTKLIALRSAGFNHVNLAAAQQLGLKVVRVPEYSPYSVAEHAVALIQTLNRKTHKAYNRVREGNFSLNGLVGFDLHGKTVGVIGTGRIGKAFAKIMNGFGCKVLLNDLFEDKNFSESISASYVSREELFGEADIISLHLPLSKDTLHLINTDTLKLMKAGVMLINTSRGALIDTKALIESLKSGHIGEAGLDVYEEEGGVFFSDLSAQILTDDVLARLLTFSNVLITSHQGFLTHEALKNIAETTLENISEFEKNLALTNEVIPNIKV